jgi:adenylyl-sulfate kinase
MADNGIILWFTGLPAAGKTTIATMSYERLKGNGAEVHLLDGDIIRQMSGEKLGYSPKDRIHHIGRVGQRALRLKENGGICIVALIAPYREVRSSVLKAIGAIEIFVDAPLPVCIARDPKGLYARAQRGEITNFTGIDDPYEPPLNPDLHLYTDIESPEESTARVMEYLGARRLWQEAAPEKPRG